MVKLVQSNILFQVIVVLLWKFIVRKISEEMPEKQSLVSKLVTLQRQNDLEVRITAPA